jgi:hypothetical protein
MRFSIRVPPHEFWIHFAIRFAQLVDKIELDYSLARYPREKQHDVRARELFGARRTEITGARNAFHVGASGGKGDGNPYAKRNDFSHFAGTISGLHRLKLCKPMWGFQKDKERERYYLLPGQGGRSARRKHRRILLWSIAFGLVVSAVFVCVMYFMSGSTTK